MRAEGRNDDVKEGGKRELCELQETNGKKNKTVTVMKIFLEAAQRILYNVKKMQ